MANLFSAGEIVEMGIRIEQNGKDFYDAVAGSSKNDAVRQVFEMLAGEEEDHIKRFEDMLSRVKKYEPIEAYPNEYFVYINSLAREYVFTQEKKGAEMAKTVKTEIEAVDMGIGFEKDSILFYQEMKRFVLGEEQGIVHRLLEEEKRHLRKLNDIRRGL